MTVPTSTYRLQLGPAQTFDQAAALIDYLQGLGIGALYVSPVLRATPGSTHGYDVVDPTRASEILGGESARRALAERLRGAGIGFVVDVVPNHMGVAVPAANPWWWEVLRDGRDAVHAEYFDIDWSRGPILLPVLADDGTAVRRHWRICGWWMAGCAITNTSSRWPRAPRRHPRTPTRSLPTRRPRRTPCTSGSTTGWCRGGEAGPS